MIAFAARLSCYPVTQTGERSLRSTLEPEQDKVFNKSGHYSRGSEIMKNGAFLDVEPQALSYASKITEKAYPSQSGLFD